MSLSQFVKYAVAAAMVLNTSVSVAGVTDFGEVKNIFLSRFPDTGGVESVRETAIKGWYELTIKKESGPPLSLVYSPDDNTLFFGMLKTMPDVGRPSESIMEETAIEGVYAIKVPGFEGNYLYSSAANLWLMGEIWKDGDLFLSGLPRRDEEETETPSLSEMFE